MNKIEDRKVLIVDDSKLMRLLLKNIVLHIPGRGRVNIGDRKIEINQKKQGRKNL